MRFSMNTKVDTAYRTSIFGRLVQTTSAKLLRKKPSQMSYYKLVSLLYPKDVASRLHRKSIHFLKTVEIVSL